VETFARLRTQLAAQQRVLYLVGVKLPVERVLRDAGELADSPWLKVLPTEAEALQDLASRAGPDASR